MPAGDAETEVRRFAKSKLLTAFSPENEATVDDRYVGSAPMQRLKWVESEAAGLSNARTVTLKTSQTVRKNRREARSLCKQRQGAEETSFGKQHEDAKAAKLKH